MNIITLNENNYLKEKFLLERDINLDILALLKNTNCYIAGGAITSVFSRNKINDYDIYFESEVDCRNFILKIPATYKLEWETDSAKSYKIGENRFQFIVKSSYMGTPSEILNLFDFTICMGAYSFKNGSFYFYDNFFKDLSSKELIININGLYPLSTLFRLRKFIGKGYKITGAEIIKLGLMIQKLDLTSYSQLREQLLGIDTAFLKELTDQLTRIEFKDTVYDFNKFIEMMYIYIAKNYSTIFDGD